MGRLQDYRIAYRRGYVWLLFLDEQAFNGKEIPGIPPSTF